MNTIHANSASRCLRLLGALTLVVGGLYAAPCLAQLHHVRVMSAPDAQLENALESATACSEPAFPTRLVGLQATMTQVYPTPPSGTCQDSFKCTWAAASQTI
jgi:hypothetical protein